jgi:RHS repeat-associated protein
VWRLTAAGQWRVVPSGQGAPEVEYVHLDALGSVRAVTGATGTLLRRHDYEPFGDELAPSLVVSDRKMFTGQERDRETGLDYFGARYYRADLGRFTTPDPVKITPGQVLDPHTLNAYAYANSNPLKFVDPTGETVKLLGATKEARAGELQVFKDALMLEDAEAAFLLFDNNGELGVYGSMSAFMGTEEAAWQLGTMIQSPKTVEFGLTGSDLKGWGGARTLEPGQDGNGSNIRILMNKDLLVWATQKFQMTYGGRNLFEGQTLGWRINPVTPPVALWHELGHAWGAMAGRSIRGTQTDAEAIRFENLMRKLSWGSSGPNNAPRRKHGA